MHREKWFDRLTPTEPPDNDKESTNSGIIFSHLYRVESFQDSIIAIPLFFTNFAYYLSKIET